jgi:predicted MPP superfamily phosphohydrolase
MHKIVDWVNDYGYWPYYHNDKIAFVSQGIGTRGLPFRLGTQSEIVLITLTNP